MLVDFFRKYVSVTGDPEDYVEVREFQTAFRKFTGRRARTCRKAVSRHLPELGVRKVLRQVITGQTWCYMGIHLSGYHRAGFLREREEKRKADKRLRGCSSGDPLIVTPLTPAHLSIPWPQSDEILVMVPANFDELTGYASSSLSDSTVGSSYVKINTQGSYSYQAPHGNTPHQCICKTFRILALIQDIPFQNDFGSPKQPRKSLQCSSSPEHSISQCSSSSV